MCGIVGIYGYNSNVIGEKKYIDKCLKSMQHRGPDSQGIWDNNENYITGFVRLAIRDLSENGRQPMVSACGNYCLSFNGEIYNSETFKESLRKKGVQFISSTDSEVLLYGLIHFGIKEVLAKFDGMFAFAFFNNLKNELILARDRVGIKPLYIGFDSNESVIFSSQYDHVINFRSLKYASLDYAAVGSYLELGFVPDNHGAVSNTKLFPHGHYAIVSEDGFSMHQYFSYISKNSPRKVIKDDVFLRESVFSQLVSDVPIGTYLSGGVDSSLLTLCANGYQGIEAFTIGTKDHYSDEKSEAISFADKFKIEHHVKDIEETDFLNLIPAYFHSHSEPFADFSSIPSLLLSKWAGQSRKVMLSGDGPDELFMGYDRNVKYMRLSEKYFYDRLKMYKAFLFARIKGTASDVQRKILFEQDWLSLYYTALFQYGNTIIPKIYKAKSAKAFFFDQTKKAYNNLDTGSYFPYIMRDLEMNINLQRILLKVDRSGMFHSVEIRVPYLSNAVLDMSLELDLSNMIQKGRGKFFLKELLAQKAETEYAYKQKKGFLVPMKDWLRGAIRHDVYQQILDMPGELKVAFKEKNLKKILDDHSNAKKDHSAIIWSVYTLINWYNIHRHSKKLSN